MLADHHKTVYLSFISTDLPLWNIIEANASLYQKDRDRFHLLLNQKSLSPLPTLLTNSESHSHDECQEGLLWLEISPYRVILTMQSKGKLSYRHFWERGVYGISRYWLNNLNNDSPENNGSLRLRNFTRYLKLEGTPSPTSLQVEYELWSRRLKLGSYVLHLDIDH
ncbi:MAG: hypothetical protein Kow0049_15560 [Stanieria sp.]